MAIIKYTVPGIAVPELCPGILSPEFPEFGIRSRVEVSMKVSDTFKKADCLLFLWNYFVWLEVPGFMRTFIVRAGSGALVLSLAQAALTWLESDLDVAFAEMGRAFWIWIKILFLLFLAILYVPRVLTKLHYLKKRLNKEGGAWENILMNGPRSLHEEYNSEDSIL